MHQLLASPAKLELLNLSSGAGEKTAAILSLVFGHLLGEDFLLTHDTYISLKGQLRSALCCFILIPRLQELPLYGTYGLVAQGKESW